MRYSRAHNFSRFINYALDKFWNVLYGCAIKISTQISISRRLPHAQLRHSQDSDVGACKVIKNYYAQMAPTPWARKKSLGDNVSKGFLEGAEKWKSLKLTAVRVINNY